MKILVNKMPEKKEACLFYRTEKYYDRVMRVYCGVNNKPCSFKDGSCRCLRMNVDKVE